MERKGRERNRNEMDRKGHEVRRQKGKGIRKGWTGGKGQNGSGRDSKRRGKKKTGRDGEET